MKDIIRKIIASILSLSGLATLGIYTSNHITIVKDYVGQYNIYLLTLLGLVFLAFFLQFGIVVIRGNKLKVKAIVAGLSVILLGYYFFVNDANAGVYAGDIIMVIGVLMIYLTLAGYIVTKQAEKAIASSKQVVIEV